MSARFDWYQATVYDETAGLLQSLQDTFSDRPSRWEVMPKAPHGYRFGQRLLDQDGQLCMVWWGGTHQHPHVVSSGESAPEVAQFLRTRYANGGHAVSRGDPCIDFAEPGAYDVIQNQALGLARDRGIKVGTAGDHHVTLKGRTLYLGATTSHTRMRLYDKAEELRVKFHRSPERLAAIPQHLARLEVQVRPQTREAKLAAAEASPVELMGSAAWTRELLKLVSSLDIEPFQAGRPWRQSDDDRAYAAMLSQYGGLLSRLRGLHGSPECLGLQICSDLDERADAKRRG